MNETKRFTFRYIVSGGFPPVDARLRIETHGQAELFLGSSWSRPSAERAQAGFFGGTLDSDLQASLNTLAENVFGHNVIGIAAVPDSVFRLIHLRCEGQETEIQLAGTAKTADSEQAQDTQALEAALTKVVAVLADQPVLAAQVTLSIEADGSQVKPGMALLNIGAQPVSILFQDPSHPRQATSISLIFEQPIQLSKDFTAWNPSKTVSITAEQLNDLLPVGTKELAAGESYLLRLPAMPPPAGGKNLYVSSQITFWLMGPDGAPHQVQVRSARIPVHPVSP